MSLPEKFATWKGVDRKNINWNPQINATKCTGCGMCITSCGRKVFDFVKDKNIALVARPLQCMVGCKSCETWCVFDAISFPETKYVKELIKKEKLLISSKKELQQNY